LYFGIEGETSSSCCGFKTAIAHDEIYLWLAEQDVRYFLLWWAAGINGGSGVVAEERAML
jgi:hypothetical protein